MGDLTITLNGEEKQVSFGTWVMGELIERGWGVDPTDILDQIAKNPYKSMTAILYLGICNANGRSKALASINEDDVFDVIDSMIKEDSQSLFAIRDEFFSVQFGEKFLKILKEAEANPQPAEVVEADKKKDSEVNQ